MATVKQNILLADCDAEEVLPFARELCHAGQGFAVRSHISNWKRSGKFSELKRYGKYFLVGFRYFLSRKRYGAIIGWQQFYALILCFFCRIFRVRKTNMVAAFNYTYKEKRGKAAALYRWFMRMCLNPEYLDYIHVPSAQYADAVSREFGYPRDRILVAPFGVSDVWKEFSSMEAPEGFSKDGYALAIGRSNRDFDFLIRAWKEIRYPLVIISDTYQGDTDAPNITILRNVVGEDSYPWIANCGLMVIPIDDGRICSGDTVLLTAMSAARKILVTEPSTLAEMYIADGENALLSRKEETAFRIRAEQALFGGKYETLGARARSSFLENFSREAMGQNLSSAINL